MFRGMLTVSLPYGSMIVVVPLLVSRKIQRRFSIARILAIFRCCQGALVSPYQPSSEMLTNTLCAIHREMSDLVGEDRFVADKDSVAMAAGAKNFTVFSPSEIRHITGQVTGKKQKVFETEHIRRTEQDEFCHSDQQSLPVTNTPPRSCRWCIRPP